MRDFAEISALVSSASHVRTEDPRQFYRYVGKLGQGGYATVLKAV